MTEDTPTEILDATHSALCDHGYAELTMQDIADQTDLCKASIHYHYDGKHDLLLAYLDHLYEQFEDRLSAPADEGRHADDPAARLRSLITSLLTERSDAPAFQTALLEIKAQSPYDEAFREQLRRFDEAFEARIREVIADGVADGTFSDDVDPDAVASFLTTHVNGIQTRHVGVGHPLEDAVHAVDEYLEATLDIDIDTTAGSIAPAASVEAGRQD
ncbi:TetR/AcrR family transcriptional regulator [Halobellus clavatus]|jgi:AcrR family transcriptional regulator|uniref:Transcriptional regulator, TetR family n=1 Tax=Halobellus clavatus TaxID=660517 RepID=A0A1H3FLH5_9EURY|nr:TetR/AcrR family transcriptional regulator [Halobellus clavatus]SDX91685.1 transcriptional regulator, TetR family [Halobellus clavatus]